jgi:hypothetical protein
LTPEGGIFVKLSIIAFGFVSFDEEFGTELLL